MARLMIEDVTLIKNDQIIARVRFKGGATKTLTLKAPQQAWILRMPDPKLVQEIDQLLNSHTDGEIVTILNSRGVRSGTGRSFSNLIVGKIRRTYGLKSRFERLREAGMLTLQEMAETLGVTTRTILLWQRRGFLKALPVNDKGECLYDPDNVAPKEHRRQQQ